jgi:C1A family cysteine protease
MANT